MSRNGEILGDGASDLQPAVVGVVGHGTAIGEDELAAAGLGDGIPGLGRDLVFGPLVEGAELVPAAHQAFAGLDAGFAQAGAGGYFDDAGFPAGQGWDQIELPGRRANGAYALQVQGDSMLPLYRDGDVLPETRGCPSIYRIYAIVAPQYTVPPAAHVAIIATYPFGFEGPDRRFIAIPLSK